MPIYEFHCRDCQKTFELAQSVADHETSLVHCPSAREPRARGHIEKELTS